MQLYKSGNAEMKPWHNHMFNKTTCVFFHYRLKKHRRTYIITPTRIKNRNLFVTVYRKRTVKFILGRNKSYFRSLRTRRKWRIRRNRRRRRKIWKVKRRYRILRRRRRKLRRFVRRRRRASRRRRRNRRRRRRLVRRRRRRRPRRRRFVKTKTKVYIRRKWRPVFYSRRRYVTFVRRKLIRVRFLRSRVIYLYKKRWSRLSLRRLR